MSGTNSPQAPQPPASASALDRFADAMRGTGISRPIEGRVLGGVCLGLGRRYGIDPVLLRVAFVVLSLFAGVGLLMYVIATLMLPNTEGGVPLVRAVRDHEPKSIFLVVLAVILLLSPGMGDNSGDWARSLISVAVTGGIVALILSRPNAGRARPEAIGRPDGPDQRHAPGQTADGTQPTSRGGGLVFDPETGDWKPSDTPRPPEATGPAQPFTSSPPSGPEYRPPAAPSSEQLAAQRADRRHRRLVSLTTAAFAVVVYTLSYLVLRAMQSSLDAQLAFAITLAALGLVLIVSGARRIRNGAAVGLAIAGLVLSGPMAMTGSGPYAVSSWPGSSGVGEMSLRPASVSQLESGHRLGVGEMALDLTQIPATELQALDNRTLALSLGVGDMTIVVPADTSVRVLPQIGVGDVSVTDNGNQPIDRTDSNAGGTNAPVQLGSGEPDLVITAEIGMGSLKIERR